MRRWRRHVAALVLMLALVGAVAVHHAAPAIGDAQHGPGMAAVAGMCLGVFTAAVAVGLALVAVGRCRRAMPLASIGPLCAARRPEPRSRAGPTMLVLLCISRR